MTVEYHMMRVKKDEGARAMLFSMFLMSFLIVSLFVVFMNSAPVVLGSERNTNGMVEYMCLGNDCEELTSFNWSDI